MESRGQMEKMGKRTMFAHQEKDKNKPCGIELELEVLLTWFYRIGEAIICVWEPCIYTAVCTHSPRS